MRSVIPALAAAFLAAPASATPPIMPPSPVPPPRLLIVIGVDQLSADLFDAYRPHFTGGLARLAAGTVFRNGYQSHASTETCPGYAALSTGTRPARNGIIANSWVRPDSPRADKVVYCAEDETVPGTSSENYRRSTRQLRVPAFGDHLKRHLPHARVVVISQKDRSALMLGGHRPDAALYLDGDAFAGIVPAAGQAGLAAVNRAVATQIAGAEPAMTPPPLCAAKARPVAIAGHSPVGDGAFARPAGDSKAWRASPASDAAVLTLGAVLTAQMGLGKGHQTDLLALGLSATDYVGHAFGDGGQEMCLQLLELDRDLGDFFARLDSWGIDYAVALSADHGVADVPERARLGAMPQAARIDPDLTPAKVSEKVRQATGIAGPVLFDIGIVGDLYLDPGLRGAERSRALAAVIAEYRRHPQVEAAFARHEIAASAVPEGDPSRWTLIERVRASFDAERSGDLYVVLKPGITPIGHAGGSVATHGSPWDYARRVPILVGRKGQTARSDDTAVETVDVAATLASYLQLPLAAGELDGKCLGVFSDIRCPAQ